jgi:hypothetical protein
MKTFWISWWDPPMGGKGQPVDGIVVWVSGTREVDDVEQDSCVALVVAPDLAAAWAKADRYYPGAAKAERRFEEEFELGWRPGDRFPLSAKQEATIATAEAHA